MQLFQYYNVILGQRCATMQHCQAKTHNQIVSWAAAACAKLSGLDISLATHRRLPIPFKNCNACFKI